MGLPYVARASLVLFLVQPSAEAGLPRGAVLRLDPDGPAPRAARQDGAGPLRNVTVSRYGSEVFIGGTDGDVSVWDTKSGRRKRRLSPPDGSSTAPEQVIALYAAPDGTVLAHAGERLIRWDPEGVATAVRMEPLGDGPRLAAFSPEGRVLVEFGAGPPIGLWDTSTGRRRHSLDASVLADLFAFSPDGRRLAVGRMLRLYLFDVETGEQVWKVRVEGTVRHMRFVPDGSRLEVLVDYEGLLHVDAKTGEVDRPPLRARRSRGGGPDRKVVAVSPDGTLVAESVAVSEVRGVGPVLRERVRQLVAASDAAPEVRVWELATGRDVLLLSGHQQPVTAAQFLPDSRRLVSVTAGGTGLVWDLAAADLAAMPSGAGAGSPSRAPLTREAAAALWRQLGDDNGEAAWRALVALLHRPEEAVRLVADPPSIDGLVQRLISQLDHEDSSLRALATRRLADLSVAAESWLRQALDANPSMEAAARLRRLLRRLAGPDKQEEIARLARERHDRELRTVRLLEWIGTPEARRLLVELREQRDNPSDAREAHVAAEAAQALERWRGAGP